jgi:hypothetical protein
MIKNIIDISDLHCGCRLGLAPPIVKLDDGGEYHHSKMQAVVWDYWNEFWDIHVPNLTKGEDYVIVNNGDSIDGVHHGSTTQISHNIEDQIRIAEQVLRPRIDAKKCKGYYHIRGTEAHVGSSATNEERLARLLGAVPNSEGQYARWELWLELGSHKKLCHFSHHIGTTSSMAYESTAVHKELVEMYNEAGRWGEKPPDLIARAHRHRSYKIELPNDNGMAIVIVTPGWQLKTPFTFRLASGRAGQPQIGGFVIREGDEDSLYTRSKIWGIGRSEIVKL